MSEGALVNVWTTLSMAALLVALAFVAPPPARSQTSVPGAPLSSGESVLQTPRTAAPDEPAVPPPVSSPVVPQDDSPAATPAGIDAPAEILPATAPTSTSINLAPGPGGPAEGTTFVDTLHGGISYGFLSTANWLDSFFGDERYEAEIGRSQLKIRFDAFREGAAGVDYRRPNFDLRLVLPQMRKKTRLVISGDPNVDVDATATKPVGAATGLQKAPERNVTTSLQYVPVETLKSNFSIRAGLKFHNGKFEVLAGPRYRYLIPLDPWDLRFTQELIWSSDMRWQSRTRFDLERPLPKDLFFRTSLEGVWSENVPGYPYVLSFLVRQPLDRSRALEYEWIHSFQTHPTDELVEELLLFRYRQRFWRDWLFLEIAPQYRFPRDKSFEAQPGILFRLEMVFGDFERIFN